MKITKIAAMIGMAVALNSGASAVQAQTTIAPREFPPASYTGRQYVDSGGCAFIRAGLDTAVQWVPRVTRARKLVCGLTPTFPARTSAVQPVPAPAPRQVPVLSPGPDVAVIVRPGVPDSNLVRRPERGLVGTVVTRGNAASKGVTPNTRVLPKHIHDAQRNSPMTTVPKGYRSVWDDDRLNPRRAEQTLGGDARMNQVWTKNTPRRLMD